MRRRRWLGAAIALALALLGVGLWFIRPEPGNSGAKAARIAHPGAWKAPSRAATHPSGPSDDAALLRGIVVDPSGKPVSGATVLVFEPLAPDALPACASQEGTPTAQGTCDWEESPAALAQWRDSRAGDSPLASTSTDGSGGFELPHGDGAALEIWARHGEAVGHAEVVSGQNEVEVVLAPGAVIRGRVLDAKGHPLSGATIVAIHALTHRMFPATPDSGGRFTTDPLPTGDFQVLASAPGFSPEVQTVSGLSAPVELFFRLRQPSTISGWVTSAARPASGLTVRLDGAVHRTARTDGDGTFHFAEVPFGRYQVSCRAGEASASDGIWVSPGHVTQQVELDLHPGGAVEGDVVGPDGAPVAAQVQLTGRDLPTQTARTDAAGHFLLRAVPPGQWLAQARAPSLTGRPYGIDVSMGQTVRLHLALVQAVSIRGRVVDAHGRPLRGARLRTRESTPRACVTDADGAFTLAGLLPGAQSVKVTHPGWITTTQALQAPSDGVEIRLENGLSVNGTVLDPSGNPMAGVPVTATKAGERGRRPEQRTRSDAEGAFTLSGLGDGAYVLTATTERLDQGQRARSTSGKVELNGSAPPPVTLRFEEGVSLRGQVVDPDGQPVPDAVLAAICHRADGLPAGNHHARSGPDGRFTIEHLPRSAVKLLVFKSGYETSSSTQVRGGDDEVTVVLTPRPKVRGRLLDPDGQPVTRFRVGTQAVLTADGTFDVPAPWAREDQKRVALIIRATGYAAIERDIPLDQPVTDLGDLQLRAGRTLQGVVVDARTGAPVVSALISPTVAGEHRRWRWREPNEGVLTGADGTFSLPNVGPDTSAVRVRGEGYVQATVAASVLAADGTIRLVPGGRIHGRVVDATGGPWPSVVQVTGPRSTPRSRVTLADGTYSIEGLPAGRYLVKIWNRGAHFARRQVSLAEGQSLELDFEPTPENAAPSP